MYDDDHKVTFIESIVQFLLTQAPSSLNPFRTVNKQRTHHPLTLEEFVNILYYPHTDHIRLTKLISRHYALQFYCRDIVLILFIRSRSFVRSCSPYPDYLTLIYQVVFLKISADNAMLLVSIILYDVHKLYRIFTIKCKRQMIVMKMKKIFGIDIPNKWIFVPRNIFIPLYGVVLLCSV